MQMRADASRHIGKEWKAGKNVSWGPRDEEDERRRQFLDGEGNARGVERGKRLRRKRKRRWSRRVVR